MKHTMTQVSAICIYKDNRVFNLSALFNKTTVPLIHHTLEDTPPRHNTFGELYEYVLEVLESNNMCCDHYTEFNAEWYDISFIDIDNPTVVSKHCICRGEV